LSIINYSNLTTAKASLRNKEIGVQKVFGSGRRLLIIQFLTESTIISFMAAILGVIIALLLLPGLSRFMNFSDVLRIPFTFLLLLIPGTLLLGIFAGIYPSFLLSSQKEMHVLHMEHGKRLKGKNLRNLLVSFQFFVSMALIAFTLLIDRQVTFLQKKDVGIEKEHVVYARLPHPIMRGGKEVFTDRIRQLPNVEKVAYSSRVLGEFEGYSSLELDGRTVSFSDVWVDAKFVDLYDLQLVKGRFFREELKADMNSTALINETALRTFDVEDPFKIEIRVPGGGYAKVVGIVRDFNYKSLHNPIEPLAIIYLPSQGAYANIKISGHNIPQTLLEIEEIWGDLAPGFPFSYEFLDTTYEKQYSSDARTGKAILFTSLIALIIAILGVLSLTLFLCESRIKETAIRKINGAKAWEVVLGLNRTILFNLLIAFAMATPAAWYLMRRWLDNFAYQTRISPLIFIVSGMVISLIAFAIVSWQSWKFANRNPAETIRYE
jgi:putative ABC transport system permease protein